MLAALIPVRWSEKFYGRSCWFYYACGLHGQQGTEVSFVLWKKQYFGQKTKRGIM
jgi:hypothetical protein